MSSKQLKDRESMLQSMAAANDLSPDMRKTVDQGLADIDTERKIRTGEVPVPPSKPPVIEPRVNTPAAQKGAAKVERNLQVTPDQADREPQRRDPENPSFEPTHRGLYHVTRNPEGVREGGFQTEATPNHAGSGFGIGTYFHKKKEHAETDVANNKPWYPELDTVEADIQMKKPFVVQASMWDTSPDGVMAKAMRNAGLSTYGEVLGAESITERLKQAGYDGIEIRQAGYTPEIGGSQIVVFDATNNSRIAGSGPSAVERRSADVQVQTN